MRNLGGYLVLIVFLGLGLIFLGDRLRLGNLALGQSPTITVSGSATEDQKSQVATFTATVMVSDDDKDSAVNQVNSQIEKLIKKIKNILKNLN